MYQKVFVFYIVIIVIKFKGIKAMSDNEDEPEFRIFFGTPVKNFEFPFFVMLEGCGGAIISEWWIATAAHCVVNHVLSAQFYPKLVCAGGHTESICYGFTYNKVVVHPGYTPNQVKDDIAVIRLSRNLKLGAEVHKVDLPTTGFHNGWLTLISKGSNEKTEISETVEKVNLYAFNGRDCPQSGNGEGFCLVRDLNYRQTTCYGDSGSPLVRDGTIIGIVSAITEKNCYNNKFTYAVNIAFYSPWIRSVTGIY